VNHPEAFYQYFRALLKAGGHSANAAYMLEQSGRDDIDPRVLKALRANVNKAAIAAGTTADPTWAGPLAAFRSFVGEWFSSLKNLSMYDSLAAKMRRLPLNQYTAVTVASAAGHNIDQAIWKPTTKLQFAAAHGSAMHAMSLLVVSDELIRFMTTASESLLNAELKAAVASQCDVPVAAALLSGITPSVSSGDARTDLQTLLAALPMGQASRPVLFGAPDSIKQMAALGQRDGPPCFPDLQIPNGGSISGIDVLSVDVLHDYGADGNVLLLVDANQCGGDAAISRSTSATNAPCRCWTMPAAAVRPTL